MLSLCKREILNREPEIIQLAYGQEEANSYIIAQSGKAVVIDACSSEVVHELKIRKLTAEYTILTHEHCDHLWGLNALRDSFPAMRVIAQEMCSEALSDSKRNKSKQYWIYAILRYGERYQNDQAKKKQFSSAPAEIRFKSIYELNWHGHNIHLIHTPGHSPGSCFICIDRVGVFSGDSMLPNSDAFIQFEDSDPEAFQSATVPIIDALPEWTRVFPGHGECFKKREWRQK